MEKNQYIVALEIGSSKIVGAIAEKTPSGYLSVRHLQEEKHVNSVRYGIVQNVENIKTSINHILKNLEEKIDGRVTQVYMGVSGRSLHSSLSEVNRSVGSTEAITRELIDRMKRQAPRCATTTLLTSSPGHSTSTRWKHRTPWDSLARP